MPFSNLLLYSALSVSTPWLSVGEGPRALWDESNFGVYWGLWRAVSREEAAPGKPLLSRRTSRFETFSCAEGSLLHEGFESDEFLDPIALGTRGEVVPLPEAPLPGHRYFSFLNLTGLFLRGSEAAPVFRRREGESREAFEERKRREWQEWKERQSPRGAWGRVWVDLEVFWGEGLEEDDLKEFRPISERRDPRREPSNWPFYFDERAHKFSVPSEQGVLLGFRSQGRVRDEGELHLSLEWNWCEGEEPRLEFYPTGRITPRPGPQRPGR